MVDDEAGTLSFGEAISYNFNWQNGDLELHQFETHETHDDCIHLDLSNFDSGSN